MILAKKSVWVLADQYIGNLNQCLGVAEALGLRPVRWAIKTRQPATGLIHHGERGGIKFARRCKLTER